MSKKRNSQLEIHTTTKAEVLQGMDLCSWKLEIPPGPKENYRLAQLDDVTKYERDDLPWSSPVTLKLRARASAGDLPGTWGFGFWNDPFSLSLGLGGGKRRFPALPNASWFFFSSPQNYLSFRNDLPANGFIAQTFRSTKPPSILLAIGALGFPFLLWSWLARKLRSSFSHLVSEESFPVDLDVTQWQNYTLEWWNEQVIFKVGNHVFETKITPNPPLGLVLWVDNQYVAFPPNGKLTFGTLANSQTAWIEIEELALEDGKNDASYHPS